MPSLVGPYVFTPILMAPEGERRKERVLSHEEELKVEDREEEDHGFKEGGNTQAPYSNSVLQSQDLEP